MKRHAFTMKLKKGCADQYKKRHDAIWPDLKKLLSNKGISDYTIYLDHTTLTLFAVQKLADDFDPKEIHKHPIVQKWWTYMADIMETNIDNSPLEFPLQEMFYMP